MSCNINPDGSATCCPPGGPCTTSGGPADAPTPFLVNGDVVEAQDYSGCNEGGGPSGNNCVQWVFGTATGKQSIASVNIPPRWEIILDGGQIVYLPESELRHSDRMYIQPFEEEVDR